MWAHLIHEAGDQARDVQSAANILQDELAKLNCAKPDYEPALLVPTDCPLMQMLPDRETFSRAMADDP